MTPNFALNLSEDGIDLLHRDPDRNGWSRLRTVALDSEDLAFELHKLRDAALAIEGDSFTTKLILPRSQLLYTTVEVEGKKRPKPKIKAALEDQTPYDFDDLVYDSLKAETRDGLRVFQVVAVARHTLQEAEAFLAPYMLNPVGFTAMPTPEEFAREPNLGPAGDAEGFKSDKAPVTILESLEADAPPTEASKGLSETAGGSGDQAVSQDDGGTQDTAALESDLPSPRQIDPDRKYAAEDLFTTDEISDDWPKEFEWNKDLSPTSEAEPPAPTDLQDAGPQDIASQETDPGEAGPQKSGPENSGFVESEPDHAKPLFELTDDAAELTLGSLSDPDSTLEDAAPENTTPEDAMAAQPEEQPEASEPETPLIGTAIERAVATAETPSQKPLSERMPNLDAALSLSGDAEAPDVSAPLRATKTPPAPIAKETPPGDGTSGFASRRRSRTSFVVPPETGDRVEKLAARIGIPGATPKPAKTPPIIVRADAQDAATPAAAKETKPEPGTGKRNARAKHLISGQRRKPAPLIPPVTVERPVLADARGGSSRASVGRRRAPDPIAELAARQAAAEPARSGLLKTFGIVLLIGIIALGSMMALTRGTANWFGGGGMVELEPGIADPDIADPEAEVSQITAGEITPQDTVMPDPTELVAAPPAVALDPVESPVETEIAAIDPVPPSDDAALVTESAQIAPRPTIETAEAAYRNSGVWQFMGNLAPLAAPDLPTSITLHGSDTALAFSGIEPLPVSDGLVSDSAPVAAIDVPERPGLRFTLDQNGLVVPKAEGALSPEGVMVFAGTPPVTPRPRPDGDPRLEDARDATPVTDQTLPEITAPDTNTIAGTGEPTRNVTDDKAVAPFAQAARLIPQSANDTAPTSDVSPVPSQQRAQNEEDLPLPPPDPALAGFRPLERPANLLEQIEREVLGGFTRLELAAFRPEPRPLAAQERAAELRAASLASVDAISKAVEEAQEEALEPPEPDGPITSSALSERDVSILATFRPSQRPQGLTRVAARIRAARTTPQTPTATARATGPAVNSSSRVSPTGPISTTVARAATDNDAISLGRVALVGVFGTTNNRRALVRMPNGRFKKVTVGDSVDGGRVAAIGEAQLKYTKGGRTVTLTMPQG